MTMVWSPDYAPVDGDFDNVSLLLKGEGTNGSTTILDSSSNNLSVTAVDNAQISTAVNTPFGTGDGVLAFDGTGDYLTIPSSTDFEFGTGDFTIEFWLWPITNTDYWILGKGDEATQAGSSFSFYNGGAWEFYTSGGGVSVPRPLLTTGTWQHIAAVRNLGIITIYKNGISVSSASIGTSAINSTPSSALKIGMYSVAGYNGYISNLRITKGVARYTENFDVPTAPFPIYSPTTRTQA